MNLLRRAVTICLIATCMLQLSACADKNPKDTNIWAYIFNNPNSRSEHVYYKINSAYLIVKDSLTQINWLYESHSGDIAARSINYPSGVVDSADYIINLHALSSPSKYKYCYEDLVTTFDCRGIKGGNHYSESVCGYTFNLYLDEATLSKLVKVETSETTSSASNSQQFIYWSTN